MGKVSALTSLSSFSSKNFTASRGGWRGEGASFPRNSCKFKRLYESWDIFFHDWNHRGFEDWSHPLATTTEKLIYDVFFTILWYFEWNRVTCQWCSLGYSNVGARFSFNFFFISLRFFLFLCYCFGVTLTLRTTRGEWNGLPALCRWKLSRNNIPRFVYIKQCSYPKTTAFISIYRIPSKTLVSSPTIEATPWPQTDVICESIIRKSN